MKEGKVCHDHCMHVCSGRLPKHHHLTIVLVWAVMATTHLQKLFLVNAAKVELDLGLDQVSAYHDSTRPATITEIIFKIIFMYRNLLIFWYMPSIQLTSAEVKWNSLNTPYIGEPLKCSTFVSLNVEF